MSTGDLLRLLFILGFIIIVIWGFAILIADRKACKEQGKQPLTTNWGTVCIAP